MEAAFDQGLTAEGCARVLVQILGRIAACDVRPAYLGRA